MNLFSKKHQIKPDVPQAAEQFRELQNAADIIDKDSYIRDINAEVESLRKSNGALRSYREQFQIVLDALQADRHEDQFLKEFADIVEHDYRIFSREEASMPNDVDMYENIKQVQSDLEKIMNFRELSRKTVGAIAGGFSSGKSTFINSFITAEDVRLATAVKPSTAIPSYVVSGEKSEIKGYNAQGAVFSIKPEVYRTLTHDTIKKLDFDLRSMIPYITINCPLKKGFEHICFVDTPGYDAPAIGSAEKDEVTAAMSLENANFLIWLIGLDSTGNIQQSDIHFLKQDALPFGKSGDESRDLYIVLNNKSDCKTENQLEDILDSTEDFLQGANLNYAGIYAFNPVDKNNKLHLHRKIDMFEFLNQKNKTSLNMDLFYQPLNDVLSKYEEHLRRDLQRCNNNISLVKKLKTAVFENNIKSNEDNIAEWFKDIHGWFNSSVYIGHLETLAALRKKFETCLIGISRELNVEWTPKPPVRRKNFCNKCGTKLDTIHKFCPVCGASTLIREKE